MNNILQFLKEFAGLFNMALIISLFVVAIYLFRDMINSKNAEIAALKEKYAITEAFTVEKVVERFNTLKEYYEAHLENWYEASIQTLEEEKQKAITAKEKEFQFRIDEEIKKRNDLVAKYAIKEVISSSKKPSHLDVLGVWTITGHNPFAPSHTYYGDLRITSENEILLGTWEIGPKKQKQKGIGLLVANTLAFTFEYADFRTGIPAYGLVLYEFITPQVMRGQWIGVGTSNAGTEECLKKTN